MNLNSSFDQVAKDVAESFCPTATMIWDPVDPEDHLSEAFFAELKEDVNLVTQQIWDPFDVYWGQVRDEARQWIKECLDPKDEWILESEAKATAKKWFDEKNWVLERNKAQEERLAKVVANSATTSLPGTIIQPTLKRTLSLSPELLTSAFSQRSVRPVPSISKASFPSPLRDLSEQSQSLFEDGTSTRCAGPFSKPAIIAPRKRRVMPTLVSVLPRKELDRFVQAQLAADRIWLQLSKLSKPRSPSESLQSNSQSSTFITTEALSGQSVSFPSLEISRPTSTGITDPLEAARAELQAMRLLLRTGKIQLTSGGTVIKGSRML